MLRSASRVACVVLLAVLGGGCGSSPTASVRQPDVVPATSGPDVAGLSTTEGDYFALATQSSGGKVVRWARTEIPVWVDTLNTPENWKAEHVSILKGALDTWAQGSNGRLSFAVIPQPVEPCIKVRWVKSDPMGLPTAGAVTTLDAATVGGQTSFTAVRIEIRTTTAAGTPEPDNVMRIFCSHELGHAIGIWGHSDRMSDVMYYATAYATSPSPRDLATLARVYAAPAEISEIASRSRVRGEPFITMP